MQRIAVRWMAFLCLMLLALPALAQLKPEEVAVVVARGNEKSERLGGYYIQKRAIPAENLCPVDVPDQEVLTADAWQGTVRPAIQRWLTERESKQPIRCLVTIWGVPLKIAPLENDPESERYRSFLEAERIQRLKTLVELATELNKVAPSATAADDVVIEDALRNLANRPDKELATAQATIESALQSAQARIGELSDDAAKSQAAARLQQLATAAGGVAVLLQGMDAQLRQQTDPPAELRTQFEVLRSRAVAFGEMRALVEQMEPGLQRDTLVMAAIERTSGLIGAITWLDEQIKMAKGNETGASFDSELSLVLWPAGYNRLRWQPNFLRPGFEGSQLPKFYRTLMVSRIDAPTLPLAKGLIDTAIEVENKGLAGKVYIDARGLATIEKMNVSVGSYDDFDRALLITARGIQEQTNLTVVLNDMPELFQPGECPEAALYCGWYSLAKYVDAFDWVPGAVAYHMASGELSTLRDEKSLAWCKKMLEDGVCATIAPVYEPYLVAFPRPEEFFAQLIAGDKTLVECYYRTQPFNSWMMVLIGDPLYRPFKNVAAIKKAE